MLGEEFLFRTPFINERFSDVEIAVASCMVKMHEYINGGEEFYGMADALQDMYICLKMDEALETSGDCSRDSDTAMGAEINQKTGS